MQLDRDAVTRHNSRTGSMRKGAESMSAVAHDVRAICCSLARALAFALTVTACQPEVKTAAPEPRPVRTVTVEKHEAGTPITLTGRIEAEDEVALAFRISGR